MQPVLSIVLWRSGQSVPQAVCVESIFIFELDGKFYGEGGSKQAIPSFSALKGCGWEMRWSWELYRKPALEQCWTIRGYQNIAVLTVNLL